MGTVQPSGVHRHMDREPRLERRDRDVRHRVRLVDHQPRRQSDHSVPCAGRRQPAVVPVHPSLGSLGRRHRFPAPSDCGRSRDTRGFHGIRRSGLPETRHPLASAGDDVPAWRRRRPHLARLGGDDTDACAQAGSRQRDRRQWCRLQYRTRGRAGSRRVGDRGVGNSHSLLGLRGEQRRDHRGPDLVAQSA